MTNKTTKELAENIPESAMAVGELEAVRDSLRAVIDGTTGNIGQAMLRVALGDLLEHIDARIEQLDESGAARTWAEAWRKAEAAEGIPVRSPLKLER